MRSLYISFFVLSFLYSNAVINTSTNYLNETLDSYVDSLGNVNYQGIIENPYFFEQYFEFIENISPITHPKYFKTDDDVKAYWINVYNALILKIMIENPEKDILDISFIGHHIFSNKFKVAHQMISPNYIEYKILRKMNDPRIHFVINCGSKSCPALGNRILIGKDLNRQLENKTFAFVNNKDNVLIDSDNRIIYLSQIFKWYKKDFDNLIEFIVKYLNADIDYDSMKNFKIKYLIYDWSSNRLD